MTAQEEKKMEDVYGDADWARIDAALRHGTTLLVFPRGGKIVPVDIDHRLTLQDREYIRGLYPTHLVTPGVSGRGHHVYIYDEPRIFESMKERETRISTAIGGDPKHREFYQTKYDGCQYALRMFERREYVASVLNFAATHAPDAMPAILQVANPQDWKGSEE